MASTKAALKAAKSALDAQNFEDAVKQARQVLEADPQNYFGNVFLGRALEKQGSLDESAEAYQTATKIKPNDELAWKGLCGVYEAQGSRRVEPFIAASMGLAQFYAEQNDLDQCQTIVDKLIAFVKQHGTRMQYKEALKTLLPDSPIFEFLEGRIQSPAITFLRLAELTETEEKERINKEIGERRTRLGAKISQVNNDVKREVYNQSELEDLYQNVINWTNVDEERRVYEEKQLQHAYDHLVALPADQKTAKRERVMQLAHGMVIVKHPFRLAWDLSFEWEDIEDATELDKSTCANFVGLFPDAGLSKVLQAFLGISLVANNSEDASEKEEMQALKPLSVEERLLLADEGIADCKTSSFAHRLVAQFFLQVEEYENCVSISRKALTLLQENVRRAGLSFGNNKDAILANLATALIYYQSPKNHPEAQQIFGDVLQRRPESTAALLGIGLIYEEQQDYSQACSSLDKALARNPDSVRIAAESAWCWGLQGHLQDSLEKLEACLRTIESQKPVSLDLKSLTSYRIGKCKWDLFVDKSSRKDRKGAYASFLASVKANPSYAPAYTSLGLYYVEYAKDKKRARQCFQKAFELSGAEVTAAEQLARGFANDSDWDLVEVVANRVIDSGVVRPPPGSKRKPVSWPFAALGVVQMNKQQYGGAVHSFQAALRIAPQDYHAWVGLGESYLSSGRYIAAGKALEHAESMIDATDGAIDPWFAKYMRGNVHRELGEYEEAIICYNSVLTTRPDEYGVLIALLQTLVEKASHCIQKGFFNGAAESARQALVFAAGLGEKPRQAFNFWKAVGDAAMTYTYVPGLVDRAPCDEMVALFSTVRQESGDPTLAKLDEIDAKLLSQNGNHQSTAPQRIEKCLTAGILAHKQAIISSAHDTHAQSVAWYNLGWTQYRASQFAEEEDEAPNAGTFTFGKCARAAVRCFKRAIELEASNSEFWNSLGVVTTSLNPKIAQHSFVRSLHLNGNSARTWTNLGVLYLYQEDVELAHEAFARAQSADPDYVYAWLGDGLIALHLGQSNEAMSHFTHAVDIAEASDLATKQFFAGPAFDKLLCSHSSLELAESTELALGFYLQQIGIQSPSHLSFRHILALLQERTGSINTAAAALDTMAQDMETLFESTESPTSMGRFIRLKADLARNQLALLDYKDALDNATTALDLSDDADVEAMTADHRQKVRLSAQTTSGLCHYYLGDMEAAIDMFKTALQESNDDPDLICVLAQALWATGGANERAVAKDQIWNCTETHPHNVDAMIVLCAIASIDGDDATRDAVAFDLQWLRMNSDLRPSRVQRIDSLLTSIALLDGKDSEISDESTNKLNRAIMLQPFNPAEWSTLAQYAGDSYAAGMAVIAAKSQIPPNGSMTAVKIAEALGISASVRDAQQALMLCPWRPNGWEVLQESIG